MSCRKAAATTGPTSALTTGNWTARICPRRLRARARSAKCAASTTSMFPTERHGHAADMVRTVARSGRDFASPTRWQPCSVGTWDSGPFDNDDAADLLGQVSRIAQPDVLAAVLGDALLAVTIADSYVEAPEMSRAVAAAAIVAILRASNLPAPPELGEEWLSTLRGGGSELLRQTAARVLHRAVEPQDNEWYELWAEANLTDEVRTQLDPYLSALDT